MIPDFLRFLAKPKPAPIKQGDWVKNKDTGMVSLVLNVFQGLVYGRTSGGRLTVAMIENVEKI